MHLFKRSTVTVPFAAPQAHARKLQQTLLCGCARVALLALPAIVPLGATLGVVLPAAAQVVQTGPQTYDNPQGSSLTYFNVPSGATLTNEGTISSGTGTGGTAVYMGGGGGVTNANTGTISGSSYGVYAVGGTAATISNAGTISGTYAAGVYISNSTAPNSIANTGLITSAHGDGIRIEQATAEITNSGTVTGGNSGILVGSGTANIGNTGTIMATGTSGSGIFGYRSTVSISNAGLVSGARYGIYLVGNAPGTITNSGRIEATGSAGVGVLFSDGNGTFNNVLVNSGTIVGNGGTAVRFGNGNDLLVLQSGAAFGGVVDGGGGYNTVELATGVTDLTGFATGFTNFSLIQIDGGAAGTIGNTGTIATAILDNGTLDNSGVLTGNLTLGAGATLTNRLTGSITNAGTNAVTANDANAVVINYGTISRTGPLSDTDWSDSDGVFLRSDGSVSNLGTAAVISGHYAGIYVDGAGTIVNEGLITGLTNYGIYLRSGTVTNSGTISGPVAGVIVTGGAGTVTNSGVIMQTGTFATNDYRSAGVFLTDGGSVTNQAGGVISGVQAGIYVKGGVAVSNAGTIIGAGTAGIGVLFSDRNGAYNNSLVTSGTIIGNSGTAVRFGNGNDLLVLQSGAAFGGVVDGAGGYNTVEVDYNGTLANLGLGTSLINFGTVAVGAGATLTNTGSFGLPVQLAGTGATLYNQQGASLSNATIAVQGTSAGVTVTNAGTIAATSGSYGIGIQLNMGGLVQNNAGGQISGSGYGVVINGVAGTVINAGTIIGGGTAGIGVSFSGGLPGPMVLVAAPPSAPETLINSGTIIGSGTAGIGVSFSGGLPGPLLLVAVPPTAGDTLINSGTIIGNSGTAVRFGSGNDLLVLQSGAAFQGVVDGGAGSNTVEVDYNSAVADLGLGTNLINFGTVAAGAGVTLANTGSFGGQVQLAGAGATLYNQPGASVSNAAYNATAVSGTSAGVTVTNAGTIAVTSGDYGTGIQLNQGGLVQNNAGGQISGSGYGVVINGAAGTIINAGTITAGAYAAVVLNAGGTVSNAATGVIFGNDGVSVGSVNGTATITNAGGITGVQYGVTTRISTSLSNTGLLSGGRAGAFFNNTFSNTLSNSGTIIGSGTAGVGVAFQSIGVGLPVSAASDTLINSGTIIGNSGTAVQFGNGNDLLEVQAGAVFQGVVDGGGGTNTIQFDTNKTIANVGFGTQYLNFTNIAAGAGATLTNTGSFGGQVQLNGTGATLDNQQGATVATAAYGANAVVGNVAGVSVTNAGTIAGTGTYGAGVVLYAGGNVTNTGTILGGPRGQGIVLSSGGTVTNESTGVILGGSYGVFSTGQTGTITNAGTIAATDLGGYGILLNRGGSIVNQASGVISGDSGGVNVFSRTFVNAASVTNYGAIRGTGTNSTGVSMNVSGKIVNAASGVISGQDGIDLWSSGTTNNSAVSVENAGTIYGVAAGIRVGGGSATITNHGLITAVGTSGVGVLFTGGGSGTIDNFGTIVGNSGTAVRFAGGTNELIIESGGVLSGLADGSNGINTLLFEGTGTLVNAQILGFQSTQFSGSSTTIDSNSTVTNAAIVGGSSVTNSGTITGTLMVAGGSTIANPGMVNITAPSTNSGSVTNSGTITTAGAGTFTNGGSFTNSGMVLGDTTGVTGGGVIVNSGTIIGTSGTGVALTSGGLLTNQAGGYIKGGQYGVQVIGGTVSNAGTILDDLTAGASLGSGATLSNVASGTIGGATGVVFTGTGASLTNNGTITGTGGVAVQFDAGANSLTLGTGSVLNGSIDGGTGAGQIQLAGTGTLTNTIANFGAGSALRIANGADWTATGNWTIANVTNAGTFQAGTTTSALNLTGNFSQSPAGTLRVALDANGSGSKFNITGTAALDGAVAVVPSGTFLAASTPYTILTASGGVTGTFRGGVTIGSALLAPTLSYDANDAIVTLAQLPVASPPPPPVAPPSPPALVETPNQHATAVAFDAGLAANPGGFAGAIRGLDQLNASGVTSSLTRLSGESHADLTTTALQTGTSFLHQFANQGALARLGAAGTASGQSAMAAGGRQELASLTGGSDNPVANIDRPWGVWTSGYGQTGRLAGDGNAHRLDETIAGGAVGADYKLTPALRVGAGLGYGGTTFSVDDGGGRAQIDHTQVALYANYTAGAAYLDGTVGFAYGDGTTRRNVSLPGLPAQASGHVTDTQVLGSLEAGYGFDLGRSRLTPFAGLTLGTVDQDAFSETGAGALDLHVAKQSQSSVRSTLGTRLTADLPLGSSLVTTDLSVGWAHEFAPTTRNTTAAFVGAPAAGFQVAGAKVPGDSALIGVGLATAMFANTSVYLRYDGDLDGSSSSHAITAGFRFSW